ncbi:MAG: AMIN domain-containing protein [Pseudomonadota bacterium]
MPELVAIEPSPGEAVTAPTPATDVKVAKPETRTASPTPAKITRAKAQAPAPTPEAAAKPTATPKNTKAAPPAVPAPKTRAGEVVMARAAQASNGWYLTLRNAASTSKGFALGGPPRAVVDLPPGSAPSLSNQDLARGPFGNLRVGRTSTRVRLVFDLTGVVSPSQIRFVTKGQDLVIEVPNQAQARR